MRERERGGRVKTHSNAKHGHVRLLLAVEGPEGDGAGGLEGLVEAGQVGRLAARVGQGAHVPVDARLPGGVEEAVEEVEEHGADEALAAVGPVDRDEGEIGRAHV